MPKWRLASIGPTLASVDLSFNTIAPVSAEDRKAVFFSFIFAAEAYFYPEDISL